MTTYRIGNAEEVAEIDLAIGGADVGVADGDRAALREPGQQRAEDPHRAERHDERLDLAERRRHAVEETAERPDDERQRHRRDNQQRRVLDHAGVQEQDFEPGHESRHRADGKIEPAAGDDQRLPDRDRGDEGAARQHVGQVVEAREARIGDSAEHADQRERQEWRDRAEIEPTRRSPRRVMNRLRHAPASPAFASTPVASTTISCSVIASPATSPAIRPLRMTMMR